MHGQKLLEQLQFEGYRGSYTTVCRFISQLKSQSSKTKEAYVPLCFEAGEAMQFDWSQEVVILGGVQKSCVLPTFAWHTIASSPGN